MKILINYADKQYEPARKWNTLTGRYIARFDKVYEYTPNDIDQSFAKLHHDILSQKRGNGLWLWKPYFVNKALSEIFQKNSLYSFAIYHYSNLVLRNQYALKRWGLRKKSIKQVIKSSQLISAFL